MSALDGLRRMKNDADRRVQNLQLEVNRLQELLSRPGNSVLGLKGVPQSTVTRRHARRKKLLAELTRKERELLEHKRQQQDIENLIVAEDVN